MDDIDKNILNEIQSDFPIASRPFLVLGERLNISEADVIKRIKNLKETGIIRRIGGNFHSGRLNFASTLCTAKVPEEKISELVQKHFDLSPKGIIEGLQLRRPIYQKTAAYGHFGREDPDFTWEKTDKAEALAADAGCTPGVCETKVMTEE